MQSFPLFLNLTGRPVLVVGEGEGADAKVRLLASAGAEIKHMSPHLVTAADFSLFHLAFVAVDDPGLAAQWASQLRKAGLLVNVADRPALCDFILPAIVDRSPVVIAVSTGGASAGVAKWLRAGLEQRLPPLLGAYVETIATSRPVVAARLPDRDDRRRFWDRLLCPGGSLDPWTIDQSPSKDTISNALDDAATPRRALTFITARSAVPDDLTLRMHRCLTTADVVIVLDPSLRSLAAHARRDATIIEDEATALPGLLEQLLIDSFARHIVALSQHIFDPQIATHLDIDIAHLA